jgi:hypothetical protein
LASIPGLHKGLKIPAQLYTGAKINFGDLIPYPMPRAIHYFAAKLIKEIAPKLIKEIAQDGVL